MRFLLQLIACFLLALAIGLGTAWYMIEAGSALTTRRIGPWTVWTAAGVPNADPYTRAHLARTGALPVTAETALYYVAHTDSSGEPLDSGCEYVIEGRPMSAGWWSIALFDGSGALIANKARRHSFSSREVVRRPDGSFRIVVARNARPGNWLPSADVGDLQLVLRLFAPHGAAGTIDAAVVNRQLPDIIQRGCEER